MREIDVSLIRDAVAEAVIRANLYLPDSMCAAIDKYSRSENGSLAKSIFADMKENLKAADEKQIPICQDTGMAVIFAEIGQDVHLTGGSFNQAVNDGIAQGYISGYLRKSVVNDPLRRSNTGDNTPGIIHVSVTDGDKITLTVAPKGFGSENMSAIRMFNPTAKAEEIEDYVVSVIKNADARPCPPVVVGVGIGGDFEYCAELSKKALCRDIDIPNPDGYYSDMEKNILNKINSLGIGPQGFGGECTALACNIEVYPTHIAGLPVGVNVGCHVTRHVTVVI